MSFSEDPKIIDLINSVAKDAVEGDGKTSAPKNIFQSLEFFPPRTDTVRHPTCLRYILK